jgi:hypothetical protein
MGEDGMHARNFMSDIFISYAHSDRARAQNLATKKYGVRSFISKSFFIALGR